MLYYRAGENDILANEGKGVLDKNQILIPIFIKDFNKQSSTVQGRIVF